MPTFQWLLLLLKKVKVHLAGTQLIDLEKWSLLSAHLDQHMAEGEMEGFRDVTLVLQSLTNRIELL